jgi:hypothetical protein
VNATASPTTLEWVKDVGLPVAGFIAGFLTSRFTMTKKDRADVDQKNYENTATLLERYDAAYAQYVHVIAAYNAAPAATLDAFTEIATKGDRYFVQLNLLAAAVTAGRVDPSARDTILLPKVRAAVRRTLPQHYNTLRSIAQKHSFPYRGELRRNDYGALYDAVKRFGPGPEWGDDLDP